MRLHDSDDLRGWGVDDVDVPPRSRLFSLSPRGMGTSRVEGLLSYLIQLARAHSVSPRDMVKIELGATAPAIAQMAFGAFFGRDAATVDGLGKYAELFAVTLSRLTGRTDLRFLTLLPLAGLLPPMGPGQLAGRPKWCSACLGDAVSANDVYRPLVWSFALYRVCSRHQLPMQDRCLKCGRTQPPIPRYPGIGRCDHCGASLVAKSAIDPPQVSELDVWLAEAIEDVVAHLDRFDEVATQRRFAEIVRNAMDRHTAGNQRRFCRQIGLADRALKSWLSLGQRPSLPQWLTICHGLGIMPSEFFLAGDAGMAALRRLPAKLDRRSERPLLSAAERRRIATELKEIVADPLDNSSASAVARRLGVSTSAVSYWFPEEYQAVLNKYRVARRANAERRFRKDRDSLIEIVEGMRTRGDYPGMRRVNQELTAHGASLGRPELMTAYRELIQDH